VQSAEEAKNRTFTVVILFFVDKTHFSAKNEIDKAVIAGGSSNAGSGVRNPQPSKTNGGSEAEPQTLIRFFSVFFQKIRIFKHTLVLISA